MIPRFLTLATTLLLLAAGPRYDDLHLETDVFLDGTWKFVYMESDDGTVMNGSGYTWVIKDNLATWFSSGNQCNQTRLQVVSGASGWIDLTFLQGGYVNKKLPGLFRLDGDTLTLAWSTPSVQQRPSGFTKGKKSSQPVYILQRVKKPGP